MISNEEFEKMLKKAFEREKREEKANECPWCERIPEVEDPEQRGFNDPICYNCGTFYTTWGAYYERVAINYCPNCGEKLKPSMVVKLKIVDRPKPRTIYIKRVTGVRDWI